MSNLSIKIRNIFIAVRLWIPRTLFKSLSPFLRTLLKSHFQVGWRSLCSAADVAEPQQVRT
jgi:hypothetical protein